MYEDKTLICKECGKEFVFTAGDRCTQQLVHAVAARQRFLSSPKMIVLFIVASALQR